MNRESGCPTSREPLPEGGWLYLSTPLAETEAALRVLLSKAGCSFTDPHPGVIAMRLSPGTFDLLNDELHEELNATELAETKCRIVADGVVPSLSALMQSQPLGGLLARVRGQWLIRLLQQRQLVTYFQPIVRCQSPQQVFAYECLSRGIAADGQLIPPNRLYDAARSTGLTDHLDGVARLTAIRTAARVGLNTQVFINFNPQAIRDPLHSLSDTIEAVCRSGLCPGSSCSRSWKAKKSKTRMSC